MEALGGMTKAIESGMAKLRIEEAATRKQVCFCVCVLNSGLVGVCERLCGWCECW